MLMLMGCLLEWSANQSIMKWVPLYSSLGHQGHNPVGVGKQRDPPSQGSRVQQPWASRRNPFGVVGPPGGGPHGYIDVYKHCPPDGQPGHLDTGFMISRTTTPFLFPSRCTPTRNWR